MGLALLMVSGCVGAGGRKAEIVSGYGAVDEPRAAQVGRAVLETGGSAADAAVAMAMTLAVTLPSRVGLAGGGVCLVHDPAANTVRTLDFLPDPAGPALVRGLYTLHAAYGRQRWEQLLGQPESLAGTGVIVSRALAQDLMAAAPRLAGDAGMRRLFLDKAGHPLVEGATLNQPELAVTLGAVRRLGLGAFYNTATAGGVAAALVAGFPIDGAALAAVRADWRGSIDVPSHNDVLHFADRRHGGEGGLAAAWQAGLAAGDGGGDGAWLGAMVGALAASGAAPAGAALSVVDSYDQAVTCALTLGGLFGQAREIPGTGLLAPEPRGSGGVAGPAILVNHNLHSTLFAGAGVAGGADQGQLGAEAALLAALHGSIEERVPAAQLLARPLAGATRPLGRVEAVACLYNPTSGYKTCAGVTDPRYSGMTFDVQHY